MDFKTKLNEYTNAINKELKSAVALFPKTEPVSEAMAYSLLAGGKRIRPVIALAVCEALGGDMQDALTMGCAIEMIHTYSLIHDDLPCMDNDTMRRGMPTCHVKYGVANALLAGDGLLTYAFYYVAKNVKNSERVHEFLKCLAFASGIDGMVGGQCDDIKAESEPADLEDIKKIHERKTGALINASGMAGAIASGKDAEWMAEYTKSLGLAFQIKDDILDIEGDEEKMGKTLLKDVAAEKPTFATLLGLNKAERCLEDETNKAIEACEKLGENGEFLKELAHYLLNREN